jgi:hypothetical protein
MKPFPEQTPLTPAVFYILLALAEGDKHGYAIMKQVKADSNGKLKMGNGTLYGSNYPDQKKEKCQRPQNPFMIRVKIYPDARCIPALVRLWVDGKFSHSIQRHEYCPLFPQ